MPCTITFSLITFLIQPPKQGHQLRVPAGTGTHFRSTNIYYTSKQRLIRNPNGLPANKNDARMRGSFHHVFPVGPSRLTWDP